jgi:site-specific DNA-methyltransferase (adenine-specific)
MTTQAPFSLRGRNPDVLTCIANLSNDEVFTPPTLANQMLDMLAEAWAAGHGGENLWANPKVRFLDPCTKSGVFLREITKRLVEGLKDQIPDLQERVDHILTKQVFGIAITQLTAMMARRSVYCSKRANGPHSISRSFTTEAGNIWFERMEHTWEGTRCRYCGAPRNVLDRGEERENYAYALIHSDNTTTRISEMFGGDMQFDVIIGNPPYQMKGGAGGTSDSSIYHLFVEQAMRLKPRYLSMVIPSRWMAGGRGLDEFRARMLSSGNLRNLTDYPDSSDAFPGVQIKGGVCFFLWDGVYNGTCTVTRVVGGQQYIQPNRLLNEFDVFIRDYRALGILRKVLARKEPSVIQLISGDTPFGIPTNYGDWTERAGEGKIAIHLIKNGKRIIGYTKRTNVRKNTNAINVWKVLVPKAYGAGEGVPHQILGKEVVAAPPSVCTQSYLIVSPFQSEFEAQSFASYYRTRLFRFLVSLRKITQDALRSTYSWVPMQTWDRLWTDTELYAKYGLVPEEIAYIESIIRPMESGLGVEKERADSDEADDE